MVRILRASVVLLAACATAAPGTGDAPQAGASSALPAPSSAPPGPSTQGSTSSDTRAVLQAVLDAPGLQPFLHPEVAGRVPVVLAGEGLPQSLRLEKFGQPVQVIERSATDRSGAPAIEIMRLAVDQTSAIVELRYDVEGLRARAELVRSARGWVISAFEAAER